MKPSIFPVMRYADAPAAMKWLWRAFGFETQADFRGPEGTVAHAELRLGAGVIGISSATPPVDANPWSKVRQGVYAIVENPDLHHDRAKTAGAEIVTPLRDMDYGSREYSVRDVGGHLWGFGTYPMGAVDGEPNLFPELSYRRTSNAPAWLARTFGLTITEEIAGPGGAPIHAEARLGDSTVMIGIGDDDANGELTEAVSIRVDDPDSYFARATSAGASVVQSPVTTHYGARSCWVRDPEGFLWGLSTYRPK